MSWFIVNRRGLKCDWHARFWLTLVVCLVSAPVLGQVGADPLARTKDEKKTRVGTAPTSAKRAKEATIAKRAGNGQLRPFYDVGFHSVANSSSVKLSDYLVDERFWGRRPTLVVVTPISPNVLQPDEGYAEAITETILRQIAADLGVRDTTEQVSKTIDFLRKLRDKAKRAGESEPDQGQREPVGQAKTEKPAESRSGEPAQPDARGLRTVQLIVLPDTRLIWNSMSVFDRNAVAERSLSKYLEKVPTKRARMLEYLEPDQFRFSAFLGKDAVNQMMDSLGLRRPEFYVLVVDRDGEVVETWDRYNLDPKQVSAVYRRVAKDAGQNGE